MVHHGLTTKDASRVMRKIFECEILVLDVGRAAVDVLQKLLWQHWWYLHGERVRECVDTCRFFFFYLTTPLAQRFAWAVP